VCVCVGGGGEGKEKGDRNHERGTFPSHGDRASGDSYMEGWWWVGGGGGGEDGGPNKLISLSHQNTEGGGGGACVCKREREREREGGGEREESERRDKSVCVTHMCDNSIWWWFRKICRDRKRERERERERQRREKERDTQRRPGSLGYLGALAISASSPFRPGHTLTQ
jgi:hypothetical protein